MTIEPCNQLWIIQTQSYALHSLAFYQRAGVFGADWSIESTPEQTPEQLKAIHITCPLFLRVLIPSQLHDRIARLYHPGHANKLYMPLKSRRMKSKEPDQQGQERSNNEPLLREMPQMELWGRANE